jgi:hypothetical protein
VLTATHWPPTFKLRSFLSLQIIESLTLLLKEEVPSLLSVACVTLSEYSKYIVQVYFF